MKGTIEVAKIMLTMIAAEGEKADDVEGRRIMAELWVKANEIFESLQKEECRIIEKLGGVKSEGKRSRKYNKDGGRSSQAGGEKRCGGWIAEELYGSGVGR